MKTRKSDVKARFFKKKFVFLFLLFGKYSDDHVIANTFSNFMFIADLVNNSFSWMIAGKPDWNALKTNWKEKVIEANFTFKETRLYQSKKN